MVAGASSSKLNDPEPIDEWPEANEEQGEDLRSFVVSTIRVGAPPSIFGMIYRRETLGKKDPNIPILYHREEEYDWATNITVIQKTYPGYKLFVAKHVGSAGIEVSGKHTICLVEPSGRNFRGWRILSSDYKSWLLLAKGIGIELELGYLNLRTGEYRALPDPPSYLKLMTASFRCNGDGTHTTVLTVAADYWTFRAPGKQLLVKEGDKDWESFSIDDLLRGRGDEAKALTVCKTSNRVMILMPKGLTVVDFKGQSVWKTERRSNERVEFGSWLVEDITTGKCFRIFYLSPDMKGIKGIKGLAYKEVDYELGNLSKPLEIDDIPERLKKKEIYLVGSQGIVAEGGHPLSAEEKDLRLFGGLRQEGNGIFSVKLLNEEFEVERTKECSNPQKGKCRCTFAWML